MADESWSGDDPVDRQPAPESAPVAETYGDYGRRIAALQAAFAEDLDAGLREIRKAMRPTSERDASEEVVHLPEFGELIEVVEQTSQRFKLFSSLSAAEALAWDRMQEAGGAENPEAFAEFVEAAEFYKALALDERPE